MRRPLSPALSPLLRRREREKTALCPKHAEGQVCPRLTTPLYVRTELEHCAPSTIYTAACSAVGSEEPMAAGGRY